LNYSFVFYFSGYFLGPFPPGAVEEFTGRLKAKSGATSILMLDYISDTLTMRHFPADRPTPPSANQVDETLDFYYYESGRHSPRLDLIRHCGDVLH
jgi:hypothetical protein